ncbi:hypothetical protein UlMin_021591 [Ulmus minor]
MIILAWNCRGLGQPSAIRDLIALVRDSNPDVLILMETKIVEPVLVSRLRRIRFGKYLYVPHVGLSGGFCLAWRDYIELEPVSISKNLISCLVFSNPVSSPWLLSAIYGPVRSVEKRDFWLNFHKEVDRFNGEWLVIGDFNGVFYRVSDCRGPQGGSLHLGLVELPSQGLKYTWSNGRGASQEIKAKLDRGIANADWWNLFPNADMKVLPQISSDHSPVVLNSEGCSSFARRPFRFEAIWTRDRRSH